MNKKIIPVISKMMGNQSELGMFSLYVIELNELGLKYREQLNKADYKSHKIYEANCVDILASLANRGK